MRILPAGVMSVFTGVEPIRAWGPWRSGSHVRDRIGRLQTRLTVKKILNHAERDGTAVYDRHSYDPEKRSALEAWGRRLDAIVSGKPAKGQLVELAAGQQSSRK